MFFIFLLVVICELGAVVRYCLVIWNSVWVLFDFPLFLEQNLKIVMFSFISKTASTEQLFSLKESSGNLQSH